MRLKIAVILLTMSAAATAQSSSGYAFFAPGGSSSAGYTAATFHAGGGFDAHLAKGVGLNMELGWLYPKNEPSAGLGVFSPGLTYYFRHAKNLKLEPFAAGGYSLMFREGHQNLYYFGGGVNWWLSKRFGTRLEFRDHVYPQGPAVHFWGVRMGVAFRSAGHE